MSDPIDSPVSLGGSRQAFFGDSFEPHRELLYRTNVDRATKGEVCRNNRPPPKIKHK